MQHPLHCLLVVKNKSLRPVQIQKEGIQFLKGGVSKKLYTSFKTITKGLQWALGNIFLLLPKVISRSIHSPSISAFFIILEIVEDFASVFLQDFASVFLTEAHHQIPIYYFSSETEPTAVGGEEELRSIWI